MAGRNEAVYGLVQSFGIDEGELDGLRPQECFVLGVEWQMFYEKMMEGSSFSMTVHFENVLRFEAIAQRNSRTWSTACHDDWYSVNVGKDMGPCV